MKRRYSRALITGINGQDGAWLAAQLLGEGIEVFGTHRPASPAGNWRLQELGFASHPNLHHRALDLGNVAACRGLLSDVDAQAIFHLAGQSRVADSFRDPLGSIHANGIGTLNLLEAMRRQSPDAHFVLASSAEIFGNAEHAPQDEQTPIRASTPYGVSKLLAHSAMGSWRQSFGLAASSAILFNHESELRDDAFVTRKISQGVARILLGKEQELTLGNLDARRDFGYAPEYMSALANMADRDSGDDYVLASGHAASIREFASAAFDAIGMPIDWQGHGAAEVARERSSGKIRVRVDTKLLRPVDAPLLVGNATKAREQLGFKPQLDLTELTRRMVEADLGRERKA
ncbi:MAG TPA: GDP-mannose 4,6-dehydratase [Dokdonella sp.]|uniref:GDP-mannose 4,6-dehydratase n=1 Tax=Dokdonella sp. TaxID=2291710 RepID=UPI002D7E3C35|nr:GDP-mannose 4,6-dehydratase [Dokdonella sp.]HET9032157.1 GDP-mannose 4,6-dehydratase [Dokdonella sp.]